MITLVAFIRGRGSGRPQQREVGVWIIAENAGFDSTRVRQRQADDGLALDDMAVGQHKAIGRDDNARPGTAALPARRIGPCFDAHDGRTDGLDHIDHRLRIGIQQRPVLL